MSWLYWFRFLFVATLASVVIFMFLMSTPLVHSLTGRSRLRRWPLPALKEGARALRGNRESKDL